MKLFASLSLASLLIAIHPVAAQISYTGGVYSQNFDSLPGTTNNTLNQTWTDNSTLPGWYANKATFSVTDGTIGGTAATFSPTAATNTNNVGLFSFGTASSTDRALGSRATAAVAGNNPVLYGVRLVNNSSQTLTSFTVTYTGEQWFKSGKTTADTLLVDYQFDATSISAGTWTNASGGTFTSPINTATAATVAGNTAANRRGIAVKVTGVSWAPGQELWIRFRDVDDTGDEQALAVDDFFFMADNESGVFLNGSTGYVTMGFGAAASSLNTSSFTVECRFMRTGPGVTASTGTGGVTTALPLVAKGVGEADGTNVDANYFLGIDNATGKLVADFEQLNATNNGTAYPAGQNFPVFGSTVLQNGVFYHVAATYDTATATWKLYVNGVAETTTQTLPTFVGVVPRNDNIQGLGIGTTINSSGARSGFFHGIIDEVRIWNYARTPAQILANKDLPITAGESGLLARYGFNEGTGTSAAGINASGGAAPVGTLSGSPAAVWSNSAALVPVNTPPSVSLTSPATGATAVAPASITLTANASDTDGTVTQVEFLRDGSVVGTDTTAPYSFTDTGVTAGIHSYTARATDSSNATTTSAAVTVSVLTAAGKSSLLFDGVNDYVTMGVAPELNAGGAPSNGFTLECWFRKEGTGLTSSSGNGGVTAVPLFGKGRGEAENSNLDCNYFFGINASGQLVADFEAYPATGITAGQNYPITGTNAAIQNNVWHHAAATYDGNTTTWTLYLDGVASGTATAVAGALPRYDSIQHFGIGAAFNSAGTAEGAFAGRIDEVRVWNYARSASEIAAAKDYEIASAPGLIGRYGLNEATGTTTANTVGVAGAPTGTLTNGPLWVDGAPLAANTPPVVALTAPADDSTSMSGAVVTLTADASDADGISRVEFYAGSTKLGEDATAPYSFDWTTGTTGDFVITAKAFDALGTSATSSAITIHVVPNTPPTVAISAPADNSTQQAPATVDIIATAGDGDGTVSKVEFFAGATKLGEATMAPYTFHWTTIPMGDYTLTAKATDNLGATTTSTAVAFHVTPPNTTPPTVAITVPADGASFSAPATINITATASDADGTVSKVEFFNGATKLGEAISTPFTYAWTNVALGDYTLTAKATDNMTATTTSAAITVHVLANQAPIVTMTGPADNATGIGASTNLQLGINDNEGDAQTVNFFGRMTTPSVPGPDFSIVAIPDTQYYSENTARNPSSGGTGAVAAIYNAQTQWCVDNRVSRNIAFVSHMGDIAQNGDTYQSEWQVADAAHKIMENPVTTLLAHGLPWGVAPGNHDQQPIGDAGGTTNYYNQYFNFSRWAGRPYYGGHFGTKGGVPANTNNYELFSASGMDFIIVHMEYDVRAKSFYQPVLDWADALLKAYPNRRAIITSHWIVNTGNPATFSTQGQDIYNALKNNPNLFLMLCGHVHGEGQRADAYQGRTVYSILSDYQEAKNGGNGFLRVFTFKPSTNQIHVESYSPTLNRAVDASDSIPSWTTAYDLNYNMQSAVTDWVPLGTVNVPANGTTASLNWTGLQAGRSFEWYATVNDGTNDVTTATRKFSTAAPTAPAVTLTAPTNGASFGLNTTINLTATASDTDGSIVRVEFFDGGTKLGESTTAPYTFAWNGATAGNHAITAVVTDDSGLDSISTVANISVNNVPPTVALTEPDPGEIFDAPASVYMTADAADSDGTVTKVEYFANGTKIGEATTTPYAFFWNNVYTGSYTLTAKATDNGGAFTVSDPLSISVTNTDNVAPSVAITSPAAGVAYAGNITITASASDTDGTVSKVEFFNGATKLGLSTTAPYSLTWNSVAVGTYTLTAKATDNDGGVTTSGSVTINVQAAPLAFSETFDSMGTAGTAPPSGWSIWNANSGTTNATWTDSIPIPGTGTNSVASMTLVSSALTVNNAPTATNNNGYNAQGGSSTDRVLATSPTSIAGDAIQWQLTNTGTTTVTALRIGYDIRRYTAVATANELPGYWLFYSLDNGATWTNVAALNPTLSGSGVQVPNTVGVTTVAPTDFTLTGTWAPGATLLLRWIDDNAVATSPDQIVGLDNVTLTAAGALVGNAPTVAITSPTASDTFTAPASISINANASDSDGTIAKVEFYNGATKLGESTTAPFSYTWTGVVAGTYSLTVRATDNDGNVATSSAVSVTVNTGPGSGTLTRAAYLQQAGPTTMTIRWRSSQAIAGRVQYGAAPAALTSSVIEPSAVTDHEVTLTGLTPNTTYYYNIGSIYDTLAGGDTAHTFTTPPTLGSTPNTRIWVLGDAGTGTSSQTSVRDAFYTWTGVRDPNLVLQLGDNAYNSGLDSEFQAKVFDIYGSLMKRVPFWSCLGNHETNQATSFVDTYPYFNIYTFPKNGECGGVASGTEHYYSWDYGNIHFISLDSMTANRSATGAMATWVTNDLASTTQPWIVCIFHHPPYTKGSHNSDTETELIEMRSNILPILEAGGVDLVLCGHSHCYERSYLLDGHYGLSGTLTAAMKKNAGDGRESGTGAYMKPLYGNRSHFGAVYSVAGSSGQISGGSLNHPAHFISLNNLGSLVIDVNGTRLDATFLRETGATNDTFTIVKQGGSTAPVVSTSAATNIASTSATINAMVNPTGTASTAKFQFGTSPSYGTDTTVTLSPNDGLSSQPVSFNVTGLQPGTTYHFRISSTNSWGTVVGSDVSFTTLTPFQQWAAGQGLSGGQVNLNADTDGDGHTALEEWAFGTSPTGGSNGEITFTGNTLTSHGGPATRNAGTSETPVYQALYLRRKDAAAAGLIYTPLFSVDLISWTPSSDTPVVIAFDAEMELVGLSYPLIGGVSAKFFKVNISVP